MDSISRKDLSKFRLEQAQTALTTAKSNFKENLLDGAVNRSYYCVFHAMRAVLALDGYDSKKHSGIISEFRKSYLKTERLPTFLSDIIRDAFTIRNESDYEDFYVIEKAEAEEQVANAGVFLQHVRDFLGEW